jgi:tripartite-type tricarboxylate transporter receptor subunit TctC
MFKLLTALLAVVSISAHSAETISIQSPYSASHSGSAAMFKILDEANRQQRRYNFILEFKPGGEQIIAIKQMDEQPQTRLAIIAPKYVEHLSSGKLNKNNYEPVWALGDACWAVITNVGDERKGVVSLRGQKELVVGGVGVGNAAHLTALQLGEKYGFQVRYIPFKSNFDALMLMAADGSVNMVLERASNYEQMKIKNPNLKMLAMSCPQRHPSAPNVQTLLEQGITAPYVFNTIIANQNMLATRQEEISKILNRATQIVGLNNIQRSSDFRPPQFDNLPVTMYHDKSVALVDRLLKKYQSQTQSN